MVRVMPHITQLLYSFFIGLHLLEVQAQMFVCGFVMSTTCNTFLKFLPHYTALPSSLLLLVCAERGRGSNRGLLRWLVQRSCLPCRSDGGREGSSLVLFLSLLKPPHICLSIGHALFILALPCSQWSLLICFGCLPQAQGRASQGALTTQNMTCKRCVASCAH